MIGIALLILFLASTGNAFQEGERFSQAQINSVNANTLNLSCQNEKNIISENGVITVTKSCLTLQKDEEPNPFIVVRRTEPVLRLWIGSVFKCVTQNSIPYCINFYHQLTIANTDEFRLKNRKIVFGYQTNYNIQNYLTIFDLDQNELNP